MNFNPKETKRVEIVSKFLSGKIQHDHAMGVLKLKERQFRRLVKNYQERGIEGVIHGNSGKVPWNKISKKKEIEITSLLRDKYIDFNMSHAREKLLEVEKINCPSYTSFRKICHKYNLVKKAKKSKVKVRKIRERYEKRGMFIQIDGSYHQWFGRTMSCLIAIVDDATSEILHARFCKAETTHDCMTVIKELIKKYGVFGIMYSDKAGVFNSRKRIDFNQLLRALDELGISTLLANSPEAKGRIERLFETLQDRLIPEMRLKAVDSIDKANKFLVDYIPKHNLKFGIRPKDLEDYFKPLAAHFKLDEIFCVKNTRKVNRGHIFSFRNQPYIITEELKFSLVNRRIEIREYADKSLAFYFNEIPLKVQKSYDYLRKNVA